MTDFVPSPHHKFMSSTGRKRGPCQDTGADESSDDDGMMMTKRSRRFGSGENECPQSGIDVSNSDSKKVNIFTDVLKPFDSATLQQHAEVLNKAYQSQIESLRKQHSLQMDNKNRELANYSVLNNRLTEEYKRLCAENGTITEENRLLKRAVQLQDQKQKELFQQINHYEELLRSAADHVQKLEGVKNMLMQEIAALRQGSFRSHNNPDIY